MKKKPQQSRICQLILEFKIIWDVKWKEAGLLNRAGSRCLPRKRVCSLWHRLTWKVFQLNREKEETWLMQAGLCHLNDSSEILKVAGIAEGRTQAARGVCLGSVSLSPCRVHHWCAGAAGKEEYRQVLSLHQATRMPAGLALTTQ